MDGSMNRTEELRATVRGVQVRTEHQMEQLEKIGASRQLPERMESVQHLLTAVEDQLDLLGHVLTPVVRPQEPQGEELASVQQAPETELASFLQHVASRLSRTHDAIADLIRRVDL